MSFVERRRAGGQEGFTLLEVLIAMSLITILVMALINGLLTSAKSDNSSNEVQRMNAALNSFGEVLKDVGYENCADAEWYQAVYDDALAGVADPAERQRIFGIAAMSDVRVTAVEYWSGASFPEGAARVAGTYGDTCSDDSGTQRLTFEVSYVGRTRSAQTVKRDPSGVGYDDFIAPTPGPIPGNTPPRASFTVTSVSPTDWQFASTSTDPGGSIAAYAWDFDDGSAIGTASSTSHTYGPGVYKVRLTVTDDAGATSSSTRSITVAGQPAGVQAFKLLRVRHGGGTSASYDFSWTLLPGVQQYEIKLEWCIDTFFFGRQCYGKQTYLFGSTSIGTITKSFPSVPFYIATIRARVGTQWGPESPEISGWAP